MNVLLGELKRSLVELVKGMDGQLSKTQAMEDLQQALAKNEVGTYKKCLSSSHRWHKNELHEVCSCQKAIARTEGMSELSQ